MTRGIFARKTRNGRAFLYRLLAVGLACFIAPWFLLAAPGNRHDKPNYEKIAREVFTQTNLARTNPQEFAEHLIEYKKLFHGNSTMIYKDGVNWQTNEGVTPVKEAIAALLKQKPLPALEYSEGMSKGAADHVKDTGPKGTVGHAGSDKSSPFDRINRYGAWHLTAGENIAYGAGSGRDMVMELIIDDGVPGRGHRENIFNADFKITGVACGYHKVYELMCVIDYAGGYTEGK